MRRAALLGVLGESSVGRPLPQGVLHLVRVFAGEPVSEGELWTLAE